jgi:RNA polymerase sigma-70 factor (ECF subfamily)
VGVGASFDSVLQAAQEGSPWAWELLFKELAPKVRGYVAVRGARDPDDLVSETFIQLARNVGRFDGTEANFRSWVFTVAHHRLIDERRSNTRRREHAVAPNDLPDETDLVDSEQLALDRLGEVRVAELLQTLTPDQRDVLALRILGQLSLEETAAATGRKVGAVSQLQRRALSRLRKAVEAEGIPR